MPDTITDDTTAEAAWLEVEDGTTYLCIDTDRGQTVSFELTSNAINGLGSDLRNGPRKVRS